MGYLERDVFLRAEYFFVLLICMRNYSRYDRAVALSDYYLELKGTLDELNFY